MKYSKKTLLIFLTYLLGLNCLAQPVFKAGYIITNDFDTITGQLENNKASINAKSCFFLREKEQKIIEFGPGDIKEYGFINGSIFESKEIVIYDTTYTVFVEPFFKGLIDLYYLRYDGNDYFFIEKESAVYELNNDVNFVDKDNKTFKTYSNKYIGVLIALLNDTEGLTEKIQQTKLERKSLIKLATAYQEKKGNPHYNIYNSKTRRYSSTWQFDMGINIGAVISKMDFNSTYSNSLVMNKFPKYKYISSNLYLDINSSYKNVFPGLFISLNRNSRAIFETGFNYFVLNQNVISFKQINIPFSFKYELTRHSKLIPFTVIGLDYNLFSGFSINDDYSSEYFEFTNISYDENTPEIIEPIYEERKFVLSTSDIKTTKNFNFHTGLGLKYQFENNQHISINFIYNPTRLNINSEGPIQILPIKGYKLTFFMSYSIITF